jgi:large subunit ribosomal protein L33
MSTPVVGRVFFVCAKGRNDPPIINARRQYCIGGAVMRVKVVLRCSECKQRNYNTMKNKKNTPERLELKKYCRFCRKHTLHNETK